MAIETVKRKISVSLILLRMSSAIRDFSIKGQGVVKVDAEKFLKASAISKSFVIGID